MKFAYADPPYPGQARKHYGPDAREVNLPLLIDHLEREFDGWALSTSSVALRDVLPLCPASVRVMAWVKPFGVFKPGVNPAYVWEPVIVKVLPRKHSRTDPTVRDWVAASVTLRRGVSGAKPDEFCRWLFEAAYLLPDDEFTDVFPGSGAVGRAWDAFRSQIRPTDAEQAVIASVYTTIRDLERYKFAPAAVVMASDVIEDAEHGRWTTLFGLPVLEARSAEAGLLAVAVRVKP